MSNQKQLKILVTGGAGYIGSQMVLKLLESNHQPIVVDDLSTGSKSAVPTDVPLYVFNVSNKTKLNQVFKKENIDAVMHFSASTDVGESMLKPEKYYKNNVTTTLHLLEVMKNNHIQFCIFSSTAAIFGEVGSEFVKEQTLNAPLNPYGKSKRICEQLLQDFDHAYGIKSIALRYFNAAGADALRRTGFRVNNAKNLIPIVLQVANRKRPYLEVFGRDYPTEDGTCIRDYVHVMDLCDAHLLALNRLLEGARSGYYNLGNGRGHSVQQIVDLTQMITQTKIKIVDAPRRLGDSAKIIADSQLAREELGWNPHYSEIETIIQHAWEWEKNQNIPC